MSRINAVPGLFILGLFLVAFLNRCAAAETYFVAPTGSDANRGTRQAPFRTIQKAADIMKAGDVCHVRGGIYRESVRPAGSGKRHNPITFRASSRRPVVVSGADPVSGWTLKRGCVYCAGVDWAPGQLFVDGRMMNMACWPNAPLDPMQPAWAKAGPGTGLNTLVDSNLPDVDLTDASVRILPGERWVSWTRPVQAYDPQTRTLTFESNWSQNSAYKVKEGSYYFLFGAPALLDAPGEWHFDAQTRTLSLWMPDGDDPSRHGIEVKRRELAFDLSGREHVRLEGFRIFAATISLRDASYCEVVNCHVRYASHFAETDGWSVRKDAGIVVGGHDNVVRDSSVVYSAGNGVTLLGENNTVENCLARYVNYTATDAGAVWAEGQSNVIRRNTLSDAGRSLILHRTLKNGRIEYNNLFNAGLLTTDLGITYCFATDGAGTVIAYNWAHHNRAPKCGVGIYIDNNSSNFIIHHNVSWANPDSGIRLNTPSHNNLVYNNTVLDNGNSISYWGPENTKDQAGCRVLNNIFNDDVVTGEGVEVSHNYAGRTPGIVSIEKQDFRLVANSPCVDAGIAIEGVTDGFKGRAPDLGAYERGARRWTPGHNWGEPPMF